MTIDLVKGQNVNLTKEASGINNFVLGLGWDPAKFPGQAKFDLDASAILIGADGKAVGGVDGLIYFKHLAHASGAVVHTGDNLTGDGDGDDEQIKVDLAKMPANVDKVIFVVNIYDAVNRKQNFGQVANSFIRIFNPADNKEITKYDLREDFSTQTCVAFGELYRNNGEWKFRALGEGSQDHLGSFAAKYGIN